MYALLAFNDLITANIGLMADPVVAQSSAGLVNTIRNFVGPILMLVCGFAAIGFLFQRQMTQFIIFAVIAVGVFAIFYAPQLLANLGTSFGTQNSTW